MSNHPNHWSDPIANMRACWNAMSWLRTQPDAATAWASCDRGDWMLWLLGMTLAGRKQLVLATCECARLALQYVPPGEGRPLRAIEAAEAWARDEGGTLEQVREAAAAAYAAADAAAYADAAAAAAYADAAAADACAAAYAARDATAAADACAAADAAAAAAYADAAAADACAAAYADAAAACAAAAAARDAVLAKCADIARRYFPVPPTI